MTRGASRPILLSGWRISRSGYASGVAQVSFRRRPLSLLAFVVLVAGCGGGAKVADGRRPTGTADGAPSASSTTASSPATGDGRGDGRPDRAGSTATTTAEVAAEPTAADDQALARRIPLTAEDLPPGYEQAPEPSGDAEAEDPFAGCEQSEVGALLGERARSQSPVFSKAGGDALLSVGSAAAVYASVEAADRALETVVPEGAGRCLGEFVKRQAGADPEAPKVGEPSVVALTFSGLGQDSAALRVTVELATDGGAVPLVTDFIFVRSGRAIATLAFSGVGEPFPLDQAEAIAARVAERM